MQKLDDFFKSPAARGETDLDDDVREQVEQVCEASNLNIVIGGEPAPPAPPENPAPPEPAPPEYRRVAGYEAQVGDTVEFLFDHSIKVKGISEVPYVVPSQTEAVVIKRCGDWLLVQGPSNLYVTRVYADAVIIQTFAARLS